MTYGQGLSHWRRNMNLRQWEVAETLHVTRQTISNWENDVSYPDLGSLFILSKKYHTSVNDILGQDYDEGGVQAGLIFLLHLKLKGICFTWKQIPFVFVDKYDL